MSLAKVFLRLSFLATLLLLGSPTGATAADRRQQVLDDRKEVQGDGFWIYNDLAKGTAEALKTGKPMLVVIRCIP